MRHDLRLEARGVGGGNLVGDKRGEALCPRRVADLCERDGAGVALDEVEILRMRFVAGEITVGTGGKAQVEIERSAVSQCRSNTGYAMVPPVAAFLCKLSLNCMTRV